MTNRKFKQVQEIEPAKPRREVSPFGEMERMFEEFFPRSLMGRRGLELPNLLDFKFYQDMQSPRVDVVDRDNEILVRAEMAGFDKDEIKVSLTENTVTISGETKQEEKKEEGDYYRCEIAHRDFSRSVALPAYVDSKKSKAKYKDGILELTLPKTEKTKRLELKIEG